MDTHPEQRIEIDLHRHTRCHKCLTDERELLIAATTFYTRYTISRETGRWRRIPPSDYQYTLLCQSCLDREVSKSPVGVEVRLS